MISSLATMHGAKPMSPHDVLMNLLPHAISGVEHFLPQSRQNLSHRFGWELRLSIVTCSNLRIFLLQHSRPRSVTVLPLPGSIGTTIEPRLSFTIDGAMSLDPRGCSKRFPPSNGPKVRFWRYFFTSGRIDFWKYVIYGEDRCYRQPDARICKEATWTCSKFRLRKVRAFLCWNY